MRRNGAGRIRSPGWPVAHAPPIVPAMPETPDLKALAERYLDLWEEQFTAAAADPALASAMAAWLAPWRAMSQGMPPVAPAQQLCTTPRCAN